MTNPTTFICLVHQSEFGRFVGGPRLLRGQVRCAFLRPGVASSNNRFEPTVTATVSGESIVACTCGCGGRFAVVV